jgi:hypothetical protein
VPLLDRRRYRRWPSSYGVGGSFRVSHPLKYHRYGFGIPALPLALAPAMRFSLSGFGRLPVKVAAQLLSSSFTFLESVTQQHLPDPPQRIRSSHGLLLPTAHAGSKIHFTRVLPARYGPPSGFGYPLDGLLPAIPCRFCFTPAALLGFTLRRFPLPEGIHGVSAGKRPHTVSLAVTPPPKRRTGPVGLGFWVSTLPRVPCGRAGF